MKTSEKNVSRKSEYFVYVPSEAAQKTFFYPICTGNFIYEPGYRLERESYDSFLLMFIQRGTLTLEYDGKTENAVSGDFILLDCYRPHIYYSNTGWESLWLHFDGPVARAHYELITRKFGHIFTLSTPYPVLDKMAALYRTFLRSTPAKEAMISKLITDILTLLLLYTPSISSSSDHARIIKDILCYIQGHYTENISVQQLADRARLSQYHFSRIFKKETSFSPHEYIRNIRINTAKYLLKTTRRPIKDICFDTGFSNVSVFCTAFKKMTGLTPAEYRHSCSEFYIDDLSEHSKSKTK